MKGLVLENYKKCHGLPCNGLYSHRINLFLHKDAKARHRVSQMQVSCVKIWIQLGILKECSDGKF